ncbi:MAG TPA: FAD-binding and (Fe-S)-binding domain-containing protein, partial [Gammaproteobacteria bacterium]
MQASADTGAIAGLAAELAAVLPAGRLVSDPLRRLAYGTDASFYRLVPQLVVIVDDEPELVAVQRACHRRGIPVTYRAAGTSLSGQAVTDSVLVKLGSGWRRHRLGPGAETISLQPGVIGAHANRILAPHGRKIGPDPASLNAAMIGGIAANNASGMCCGTAQNSYRTLVSLRVVLADGTLLDTADGASRDAFRASHGALLDGLAALAARVRGNPELAARIEKKFRIKNTTGYSLNALVDFDDPFEILQHLMIGSEGTLGFIAEITYRTVVEHPHTASALAFFPTIEVACDAATALKPQPVAAVELIDRAGLRSVEQQPGLAGLKGLDPEVCALLVEVRGADAAELAAHRAAAAAVIAGFPTVQPVAFTDVPAEYGTLWNVRKGLLPAVGAMREAGTTVIIEDVAFPIERLSAAVRDLQQLFASYRYDEVILFGHALEGNLHCVFTQDFATAAEVQRYAGLMDGIAALVVGKYDGSLKAEHGTGRNMAPYVEMEWGGEAYALMQQIKALFDPGGLLNPGVILNRNPQVHLENLKPLPAADPIVDKCIECGFCEPDCPSRELTLSPRQRIAGWRELSRLAREEPDHPLRAELAAAWQYQAIDTCAADGLCSLACPVGINTGDLIRALRHDRG